MVKWEDLNATEQFVTERVLSDIDSGEIDATEDEIRWAAISWDQEYGYAGGEEADVEVVVEMVEAFLARR